VARRFIRILEPADPWLSPEDVEQLSGEFGADEDSISIVEITEGYAPEDALAAFHGHRRGRLPHRLLFVEFSLTDLLDLGGRIKPTPAEPPWPPEYRDAHHDVVDGMRPVAARFSEQVIDGTRVTVEADRTAVVQRMLVLEQRADAPESYRANIKVKMRKLAGTDRTLVEKLAAEFPNVESAMCADLFEKWRAE
jgi:hypothetical protein